MPRPSAYVLNKLRNFEWVELFYFTPEGCDAALEDYGGDRSTSNKTFGFSEVNGVVALKPLVSFKATKNVINDCQGFPYFFLFSYIYFAFFPFIFV